MKTAKQILHIILKTIEILIVFILLFGGLGFGLLYINPVEIKEFLPTLEEYIIPKDSGLKLNAESVTLRAAFERTGLFHIDIKNMDLNKEDNTPILKLPTVKFSYDLKNIVTLNYVPNVLKITDATLYLIIGNSGQMRLYGDDAQSTIPPTEQKGLELTTEKSTPFEQIIQQVLAFRALAMSNTTIKIEDQQKNQEIALNEVSFYLERQKGFNHAIQLAATLMFENHPTPIKGEAQLNRFSKKMSFDLEFDTLDLTELARYLPFLSEAKLIVEGKANGLLDFGEKTTSILSFFKEGSFQLKTLKEGSLNLPEPLTNIYPIESAVINGAIDSNFNHIKIAKSTVQLKNGPKANLSVEVSGIGDFMEKADLQAVKTTLKADLSTLPLSQVPDVWPVGTGPSAHAWVKENLKKGTVEKADFTLYFIGDELTDLYGELPVNGAEVRYLDEMTPVNGFAGTVKLYPDRVLITGNKGSIWNLKLTDASIDLTDLQDDIPHAKIILDITGPVQEAMNLISEKPLEFTQMFGLNPKKTDGKATVHVDLAFPLIDDLTTQKVKANVTAQIAEGIFPTPLDTFSLAKGELALSVTNKQLNLEGTGEIKGIPLHLKWTESFIAKGKADIQSDYEILSHLTGKQLTAVFANAPDYIQGEADLKASIKKSVSGLLTGNINVDFKKAFLNLYPLFTQKPFDIPADLSLTLKQEKDKTNLTYGFKGFSDEKALSPIQITGTGIIANSDWQMDLTEMIAPKTNMTAHLNFGKENLVLKVKGKSWNAKGLYDLPKDPNPKDKSAPFAFPKNMEFEIDLNRLILADDNHITTLMGKGVKKNNRWQSLNLNAMAGSPFNLSYLKKKDVLTANTPDLGALLTHLGITEKMIKGSCSLEAKQLPTGGFEGKIEASDVILKEPGFLIQASTILGIVDGIRGKDLLFSEGLVPFELTPDAVFTLNLGESYLTGNSLGITFMGKVTGSDLSLTGSVIPAYMINSLPGKIPLIGVLFKNSDGGGLIGARYDIKGTLSAPDVTFHPLDSMAPGIFGKFFD